MDEESMLSYDLIVTYPLPVAMNYEFSNDLSLDDIESLIVYCKLIQSAGAVALVSERDLSLRTGLNLEFIYGVTNDPAKFYRRFYIAKKSGGSRLISEPLPNLKNLHSWILKNILDPIPVHVASKAYHRRTTIKDNAKLHRGQESVVTFDIQDFFQSISVKLVYQLFFDIGYTRKLSTVLSRICTLDGGLPQGAPTSGAISNRVMFSFDQSMMKFSRDRGLRYSRYADDITFSGKNVNLFEISSAVRSELSVLNLKINNKKSRVLSASNRQIVTGVIVNKKINVSREFRLNVRQACYYINRYGIHGHARVIGFTEPRFLLEHLIGQVSHWRFIDPKSTEAQRYHKMLLAERARL